MEIDTKHMNLLLTHVLLGGSWGPVQRLEKWNLYTWDGMILFCSPSSLPMYLGIFHLSLLSFIFLSLGFVISPTFFTGITD